MLAGWLTPRGTGGSAAGVAELQTVAVSCENVNLWVVQTGRPVSLIVNRIL